MENKSPYYVITPSGKLELTKGTYLTMMKRKQSTMRTLNKNKYSRKDDEQFLKKTTKKTIRKMQTVSVDPKMSRSTETVTMFRKRGQGSRTLSSYNFPVEKDGMIFGTMNSWTQTNSFRKMNESTFTYGEKQKKYDSRMETEQLPYIEDIPWIEMEHDNDEESEWPEINSSVDRLVMSLSVAAYDNNRWVNGYY